MCRTLTLPHPHQAAALPATVTAYRIDAEHANPQAAWQAQGSPTYPTPKQLAELDKASEVNPAEAIMVRKLSDTRSTITFAMPPYSALHLTL